MRAIGLDIGATHVKSAMLFLDERTTVITGKHVTKFPPFAASSDLEAKVLPADAVLQEIQQHLDRHDADDLFLCCQQGGAMAVLIDEHGPVRPADEWFVSWMDRRCSKYRKTSMDVFRATEGDGRRRMMFLGDWLTAMLTGRWDFRHTHRTNWNEGCVQPPLPLGEEILCQGMEVIGKWNNRKVWRAVGDHACAVHGVELGPDELSVNCGTGCQVSMLDQGWGEGPRLHQQRPGIEGTLMCVTHLPGGRAAVSKEITLRAAGKWAAQAARNLRPFRKVKLSGGVCEMVDGRSLFQENYRNRFNESVIEELGVEWEIVEDATLRGLARIAREVLK